MVGRRFTVWALVAGSALAAASVASAAASSRTVATVTTADYRSVVVATKTSGGRAPTAAVTVDTFGRAGGHWQRLGARRLSGPFFRRTTTAPHALCRLEIVTASLLGVLRPRVVIQLLRSPALGCASAETVPIPAR
jgi:hypothetical protein